MAKKQLNLSGAKAILSDEKPKLNLSGALDVLKKKEVTQPVAPTTSQPLSTGSKPFQTQVDSKNAIRASVYKSRGDNYGYLLDDINGGNSPLIGGVSRPSVLLTDEQKLQQEQKNIGERFKNTPLNVPTEFGKVANFMDAAKKVKDTLPQAPQFRRVGEIPRMQPTEMTEGQRLGDSLTKGEDFQEIITDKLTNKKTGLQKQIEAAQDAFSQAQGGELVQEIEGAQQLNRAMPEAVEAERERKGNYTKYLYNQFLDGTGSAVSGLVDFALALDKNAPNASPLSKSGLILDYYRKKNAKGVRSFLKDNIGFEVDKGLEAKYNAGMLTGAIGGLASSAPAMLTAGVTMGGSMAAQMYDGALQSIESQPDADKWDNDTKTLFAGSLGLIQGQLEKYGLDKILKGGSGQLTDVIFRKILKSAKGKGITGHVLENLIDENVKGLARVFAKGGVRAVDGFVSEFYTGAGQEASAIGIEGLFDKVTGKPIFNTSDKTDWIGFVERIAKAGGEEGVGGFVLGGGVGLLSATSKKKVKEGQAVINEIDRQLDNPDTRPEVMELLLQRKADVQANIDDVVDEEADVQANMSPEQLAKSQELTQQLDKIELALQDPNTGESVKADLESQKQALEKEIDETLKAAPKAPQPRIETEEDIIKEIRAAEKEFNETGDTAEYQLKINDLNQRLENLVPEPEVEGEVAQPTQEPTADALKDVESTAKALDDMSQSEERNNKGFGKKWYDLANLISEDKFDDRINDSDYNPYLIASEEYHKAKADGSNPELVEAVENLLKPQTDAVQEQAVGQVPVQPKAPTSQEVEQGKPESEVEGVTQEGQQEEVKIGKVKQILSSVNGDISRLAGDSNASKRAFIIEAITGQKVSKANAGVNKLKEVVKAYVGITPDSVRGEYDQINQWAKGEKATTEATQVEQTPAQQVEQLRADEQTELNEAITNAAQYQTDGKVDRAKITDTKDLKTFDEIYDKYDKLISPLLPKKETKVEAAPAKEKAAPRLKPRVETKVKFAKAIELFNDISATDGGAKKRTLTAKRRTFLEQNPSIKYIDDNWKNISKQLEAKGLITKEGNCP